MSGFDEVFDDLIERIRKNLQGLRAAQETPLSRIRAPKLPGVYMLFFEGKLQYIGSSGNLHERIRMNLLSGNRESHTLIDKLCELRNWNVSEAVNLLKSNSSAKFIATNTEDDAKILEDVLIAIYHPFHNTPLRKLKRQAEAKAVAEKVAGIPPKRERKGPNDEAVLAAMSELPKPITSTVLRDHFNLDRETGRDIIRRIMRGLQAEGKVKITETGGEGKRKQYVYELVA